MTESTQNTDNNSPTNEENTMNDSSAAQIEEQVEQGALAQQLEAAQQQVAEYHDKMLRIQAEMENLRKRTERDLSNAHKYAIERFANELLQVKDSLELGLDVADADAAKLREGTQLTIKMFTKVLQNFAIEEIDPCGEVFDPHLHQAMTTQESSEHDPNTVISVMQKGYTLHERLLRPAMVIVAKPPEAVADESG